MCCCCFNEIFQSFNSTPHSDFRFYVFPDIDKFKFPHGFVFVAVGFEQLFLHEFLSMNQLLHLSCLLIFNKKVFVGWQKNYVHMSGFSIKQKNSHKGIANI